MDRRSRHSKIELAGPRLPPVMAKPINHSEKLFPFVPTQNSSISQPRQLTTIQSAKKEAFKRKIVVKIEDFWV